MWNLRTLLLSISKRSLGDWDVVLELCKGILGEENITVVEYDVS